MKKLVLISILFLAAGTVQAKHFNMRMGVTFDYFYTSLSPHGEWIELDHDVVVWRPMHVRRSWSPYSDGRWVWTSDGWYWDSYEPFGWATYHYGRWFYDDFYGWVWLPDYDWAPAWVEWRYNDHYIGWAPLPPYASFHIGFGIRFSTGWHSHHRHWNFIGYNHFGHRNLNIYIVDRSTNINIYNNTKYRTNYRYRDGRIVNGGIDRNFVEKRSGYRIAERRINTTSNYSAYRSRENNDSRSVTVFRPSDSQVQKSRGTDRTKIKRGKSKSSLDVSKITRSSGERNLLRKESKESKKKENISRGKSKIKSDPSKVKRNGKSNEMKKYENYRKKSEAKLFRGSKKKSSAKEFKKNSKSSGFKKKSSVKKSSRNEIRKYKSKDGKQTHGFKSKSKNKAKSYSKPSKSAKPKSKASSKKKSNSKRNNKKSR